MSETLPPPPPDSPSPGGSGFPVPASRPNAPAPAIPPGLPAQEGAASDDLLKYLYIVLHRKWLILFCATLSLGYGLMQLSKEVPVYTSTATIKYVPQTQTKVMNFGDVTGAGEYVYYDDILSQVKIIRSDGVVRAVIEALGMEPSDAGTAPPPPPEVAVTGLGRIKNEIRRLRNSFRNAIVKPLDPITDEEAKRRIAMQGAIQSLQGRVEVGQQEDTNLIDITVADTDPLEAARIADEFCRQYMRLQIESQTQSFQYALTWLKDQMENVKNRLADAENKLYEYKGQYDQRVLDQTLLNAMESMRNLTAEIEDAKRKLARSEADLSGMDDEAIRKVVLDEDNDFRELNKKLDDLKLQKIAMAAENLEGYQPLKKLEREIAAVEEQVRIKTRNMTDGKRKSHELDLMRLAKLQEQYKGQEEAIQKIQGDMIKFRVLQREVESTTGIYESLVERSKQIDLAAEIEPSSVVVINPARISTIPASPNVTMKIYVSLLAGIVAGVVLAFGLFWIDRTVKDTAMVEAAFGLPTLGSVPYLGQPRGLRFFSKRGRPKKVKLVAVAEKNTIASESFRGLRTSLLYSTAGHAPRVILVTSSIPREGKSTVASNLAAAFATRGDKTLLVDADLKAAILHKSFDVLRWPGLTEVITGQETWTNAVKSTEVENLFVLAAGRPTPSPVELLESQAMFDLLNELRGEFQAIIVDSAPILGMADSLVLSRAADGVCIVVNHSRTHVSALHRASDTLHRMGVRLLGAIYNYQVKRPSEASVMSGYGYGYGYGYGCGYGYGYGYGSGYGYGKAYGRDADDEEPPPPPPGGNPPAPPSSESPAA